jgi:uncharacterized protein
MISKTNAERAVEFLSDGIKLRGVVRLPNGDGPHPFVVLGHGLGGLKEWTCELAPRQNVP